MHTIKRIVLGALVMIVLAATQTAVGETVTFTFEMSGVDGDVQYGTMDSDPVVLDGLVRYGFLIDVEPADGLENLGRHWHEVDSIGPSVSPPLVHLKVPNRPEAQRGVMFYDETVGAETLFFEPESTPFLFSLQSLVVGQSTSDNSGTTAVRLTALRGGSPVGTVDLATLTNAYTSYSGAGLGPLEGLFMDRLEIHGVSTTTVSYSMFDDMVFEVIPEPSALGLTAVGLLGLLGWRRKFRI